MSLTLDPPIIIDRVLLSGIYPDTLLVVTFHEAAKPDQQFGWRVRIWEWEHGSLQQILQDDPAHLADMLMSNLEEIVDSDAWYKYTDAKSAGTIWIR